LTERVKPERDALINKGKQIHEYDYWKFWDKRLESYESISKLSRVLFHPFTSKYMSFGFEPTNIIFAAPHIVIALEKYSDFAILQSSTHEVWARLYGSTLETRLRYVSTDILETFPFTNNLEGLEQIGETYYEYRSQIMLARQEGLTSTYNRFHNPEEGAGDIVRLRELHVEMDKAVASAYGWDDLELGHDFHETAQGVRFTVSESARREVLSRLLRLNHERWEEEQKAEESVTSLKGAKKSKSGKVKKSKSTDGQMGLL
jgi:hypothetical protein